jgi:hypothetical protein
MAQSRKNGKTYPATEVGTLVESFRNDISVIAEDLVSVKNDAGILNGRQGCPNTYQFQRS